MSLVSPAKYPSLEPATLKALTQDIVLELCHRLDERGLQEKHSHGLQRWLDLRAFVSDVLAETTHDLLD